jgi:hypothetical protein
MGSITLTNLPAFVEQPERQITHTFAGLDKMTCVFLGPWYLVDQYTPKEGTPHPDYPFMFAVSSTVKSKGALWEISVDYAGRIDAGANANFISESVITSALTEKEFSYQVRKIGQTSLNFTFTSGSFGASASTTTAVLIQYKISLASYSIRYLTNTVTIKYVTNNPNLIAGYTAPIPVGIKFQYTAFMGQSAFEWVANLNNLDVLPVGIVTSGLVNEQITQIGPSWYEKADSYEERWVFSSD